MKTPILLSAMLFVLMSCSKPKDELQITNPNTPALVDPVNWSPSVVQTNTVAKQFNFGKVKLQNGMSAILTNMSSAELATYNVHVYLRMENGQYLHIPVNSAKGVAYSFYLKAVNPNSSLYITRTAGEAESYEDVLIVGAKNSFLDKLPTRLNFNNYGEVKIKLGL